MKTHVLLVEDDGDARTALLLSLERLGYTCEGAGSVAEAARALENASGFDAVVTDLVLADDDRGGLEVLRLARERRIGGPVILITAFADILVVKAALNGGCSFLLEKPFRGKALAEVLERCLESFRSVDHLIDRALARAALTEKESEVARLVLKGLTSPEIANVLQNSEKTIRQHIGQIYLKFGVATRAEFFHHIFPS
jgi:DNA-binding NarL/FixJ family response regulator